nr:hypothetical protein [Pandoravirus belohorizontensis]
MKARARVILLPLDLGFFRPRPAVLPCAGGRVCARACVAPSRPTTAPTRAPRSTSEASLSLCLFCLSLAPSRRVALALLFSPSFSFHPLGRSRLSCRLCEKRPAIRVHREPEETTQTRGNLSTAGLDNVPFCPLGALLLCPKASRAGRAAPVFVDAFVGLSFRRAPWPPFVPCLCGIIGRARARITTGTRRADKRGRPDKEDDQAERTTVTSRDYRARAVSSLSLLAWPVAARGGAHSLCSDL